MSTELNSATDNPLIFPEENEVALVGGEPDRDAVRGQQVDDFKPPKDTKYALVGGRREAFRPGTEPSVAAVIAPIGPAPEPGRPLEAGPTAPAPGAPRTTPEDLNGLF